MKVMKYYVGIPLFILLFLIQTTMLWRVPVYGISPNLLLCMIVAFSFLYEGWYGLVLALVFGALLDFGTSQYFGTQTVGFVLAFAICAFFRRIFNHEKLLPDMLMALIATPINTFFVWAVYWLTGNPQSVMYTVHTLPTLLILHTIIVAAIHLIFVHSVIRHRKDRRLERYLL